MANSERSQQVETLKEGLNASSEKAKALFTNHSAEQLLKHPANGGWSAAECIEHLTLTTQLNLPSIDAARQKGARESFLSSAPFKLDIVGGLLLKFVGPEGRFKVKATAGVPITITSAEEALNKFLATQHDLLERLEGAAALSLDNIKTPSVVNPMIKFNIYSLFCILEAHQRRHILQAEKAAS